MVSHRTFAHCLIPIASLEANAARHRHLARHGDTEWPLSPACGCWKGGEQPVPVLLQQPSWAIKAFTLRASQCHSRAAQREESPQQPSHEVREQTNSCSVVLSCRCRSGVGNGKESAGKCVLVSSLSETFCARFFPSSAGRRGRSPGDGKSQLSVCDVLGVGWLLPGAARRSRVRQDGSGAAGGQRGSRGH